MDTNLVVLILCVMGIIMLMLGVYYDWDIIYRLPTGTIGYIRGLIWKTILMAIAAILLIAAICVLLIHYEIVAIPDWITIPDPRNIDAPGLSEEQKEYFYQRGIWGMLWGMITGK